MPNRHCMPGAHIASSAALAPLAVEFGRHRLGSNEKLRPPGLQPGPPDASGERGARFRPGATEAAAARHLASARSGGPRAAKQCCHVVLPPALL